MPSFIYREVDASKMVYELLKNKGFPDVAINSEPLIAGDKKQSVPYRPDFLLVDPVSNDKVAIIEVKLINDETEAAINRVVNAASHQLMSMLSVLEFKNIEGYVITISSNNRSYKIFSVDGSGNKKQIPEESFNYDTVVVARRWKLHENFLIEKGKNLDNFTVLCWWLAGGSFFVATADFICSLWHIILIGPNRILLIGISAVLVLFPYFQRFRAFGIEFDRMSKTLQGSALESEEKNVHKERTGPAEIRNE